MLAFPALRAAAHACGCHCYGVPSYCNLLESPVAAHGKGATSKGELLAMEITSETYKTESGRDA
jgi:hypothetical protein